MTWDEIEAILKKPQYGKLKTEPKSYPSELVKQFNRIDERDEYLKNFRIGKVLTLIEGILSCKNIG